MKMSLTVRLVVLATGPLAVAVFSGCDDSGNGRTSPAARQPNGKVPAAAASAEPLPAGLVLAESPSGAKDVADVRKTAKDGDTVVVRGRVGGREHPFTEGRATLVLMD